MDLAAVYRSVVKIHFPDVLIVADRFQVIRLINYHFLACWREIDPVGAKKRGMMSLQYFDSWREEIARMWRFTRSNSITEGYHNKWRPSVGRPTATAVLKTMASACW